MSFWKPKGRVWYLHNSDEDLGKHHECEYKEEGIMMRSNKGWMGHKAKSKTYKCSKCGYKIKNE